MSSQNQLKKSGTSPLSRDVFISNSKIKQLQQQTEQILKKNQQQNKNLETNLNLFRSLNGDASPSQNLSEPKIQAASSSAAPSSKLSQQDLSSSSSLSNKIQQQQMKVNNASKNGSLQQQRAQQRSITQVGQTSCQLNLSKTAQNTLKQLQQSLHYKGQNKASQPQPKNTSEVNNLYYIPQNNNHISNLQTSGKSVSNDDTPKFKPFKISDQITSDFQTIFLSGNEKEKQPDDFNVLSSVFSFGHDSDDEERVKRSEPAKLSQFSPSSQKLRTNKKRVSFCSPVIHCYSTDDHDIYQNYTLPNMTEKYPSKSNLSVNSLSQIPSNLQSKQGSLILTNQRSSTPQTQTNIQPQSIIKKYDSQQQRSSYNSISDMNNSNNKIGNVNNNNAVQNGMSNNNININNLNKNIINNFNNYKKNDYSTTVEQNLLNNHAIFESFAPKPLLQNTYIDKMVSQPQEQQKTSITEQQNNNNNLNNIFQNALLNIPIQNAQIDNNENKIEKQQNDRPSIEEIRKNLVKKEQSNIAQIIQASPIRKTTSKEFFIVHDITNENESYFMNKNNESSQINIGTTTTQQFNANQNFDPKQIALIDLNNSNIEQINHQKDINNQSNINNQFGSFDQNLQTNKIKDLSSVYQTIPYSIPQSTLLNNNIHTNSLLNTYKQPYQQIKDIDSISSLVTTSSPPFRSIDQNALAGSLSLAVTDIKLSAINPIAITSSFALGSHITLSPQESIISTQSSQNQNQNNINPINSYLANDTKSYSNVTYLSNKKGISMPTAQSTSDISSNHTNSNTTTNTISNNSYQYNLDMYKVNVPSFDLNDRVQNRQEGAKDQSSHINTININLEQISNSCMSTINNDLFKEDLSKKGTPINNMNNLNNPGKINLSNNYINFSLNSPFSCKSNQNTTITSQTVTTNNRQSFETNWRNDQDLTPSEYFLSFITNNPKPSPIPSVKPSIPQHSSMNATRKNSTTSSVKDSFVTTSHYLPLTKETIEIVQLDNSIELHSNNFQLSGGVKPTTNLKSSQMQSSSISSYGLQKQDKSPSRYTNNSLRASNCSISLSKKQSEQQPNNSQKNLSFSNYLSSSSTLVSHGQSPSKQRLQKDISSEYSNSLISQKSPIFLEYNNISTIKKPIDNQRKVCSNTTSRKTSSYANANPNTQNKKETNAFYNIQKFIQPSKQDTSPHLNQSKDLHFQQNYYQLPTHVFQKESFFQKNFPQDHSASQI